MGTLIVQLRAIITRVFEYSGKILDELRESAGGADTNPIFIQIAGYRDYDQGISGVLEVSPWQSRPERLVQFLRDLQAKGGGDYPEAVEIGLWHAVQEMESSTGLTQVILIADAPAKSLDATRRDRQRHGGEESWLRSKFGGPTNFREHMNTLASHRSPVTVHTLYLARDPQLVNNFNEIHAMNADTATDRPPLHSFLDVSNPAGETLLMDLVSKEILHRAGGEEAVNLYELRYGGGRVAHL